MGIAEKIEAIEAEMAKTQKNKATNYHLGTLKAKISKLRNELIESKSKSGPGGEGFEVAKNGDARVAMIGFPSVGKSTLLSTLTDTKSVAAAYEFTTLTCIPGVLRYNEAKIQLLDLPGIIEGAARGKGKGKQVIAVARTADLVMMVLDASKAKIQKQLLTKELYAVGIRLNEEAPDATIKPKKSGGVVVTSTVELTKCPQELMRRILKEYKIHNAHVLIRGDITPEQFIDVVEGNRKYIKCLYVVNKIDTIYLDEVDRLAHAARTVVISCAWELNLEYLLTRIWKTLDLIRVYTKPRGKKPSFVEPLILRKDSRIGEVCQCIHRSLVQKFKFALVWGHSAKHDGQRVGIDHRVKDGDVITLALNK